MSAPAEPVSSGSVGREVVQDERPDIDATPGSAGGRTDAPAHRRKRRGGRGKGGGEPCIAFGGQVKAIMGDLFGKAPLLIEQGVPDIDIEDPALIGAAGDEFVHPLVDAPRFARVAPMPPAPRPRPR